MPLKSLGAYPNADMPEKAAKRLELAQQKILTNLVENTSVPSWATGFDPMLYQGGVGYTDPKTGSVYDPAGNVVYEVPKIRSGMDDLPLILAIASLPFAGPALFEALGLTGAGGAGLLGAEGATAALGAGEAAGAGILGAEGTLGALEAGQLAALNTGGGLTAGGAGALGMGGGTGLTAALGTDLAAGGALTAGNAGLAAMGGAAGLTALPSLSTIAGAPLALTGTEIAAMGGSTGLSTGGTGLLGETATLGTGEGLTTGGAGSAGMGGGTGLSTTGAQLGTGGTELLGETATLGTGEGLTTGGASASGMGGGTGLSATGTQLSTGGTGLLGETATLGTGEGLTTGGAGAAGMGGGAGLTATLGTDLAGGGALTAGNAGLSSMGGGTGLTALSNVGATAGAPLTVAGTGLTSMGGGTGLTTGAAGGGTVGAGGVTPAGGTLVGSQGVISGGTGTIGTTKGFELPSLSTIKNALTVAGLLAGASGNTNTSTPAPFTMAPYVPPSGKPFANLGMSPIATPYTPTRILGQYDPTMTPGGVSPYELIMAQMQAPKNLYADFEAGTNIGGFDPQRFVIPPAAAATALPNYKGGMINKSRMVGPNPMGPDNGFASIQDGEFVMNRKATQKYGIELMNAINSGKISKGKLSGLLEA